MSVKRGQSTRNGAPVKHNKKAIIISMVLATTGVISAVYLYQYTHTAKLEQQYNKVQSELLLKSDQLDGTVQDKVQLEQQVQELNKVKQELESQLQAKRQQEATLAVVAKKSAQASSPKPTTQVSGTKTDWMRAAGIPQSQWQYVDYIVGRESGWNPNAVNKSSGACSLAQALPCSKIGANWRDPVVALKWQFAYVNARYGGYAGAYAFWSQNSWY